MPLAAWRAPLGPLQRWSATVHRYIDHFACIEAEVKILVCNSGTHPPDRYKYAICKTCKAPMNETKCSSTVCSWRMLPLRSSWRSRLPSVSMEHACSRSMTRGSAPTWTSHAESRR